MNDILPVKAKSFVWGRECNKCSYCITRAFNEWEGFKNWLFTHNFIMRNGWKRVFDRNHKISIYYCKINNGERRVVVTNPNNHKWYNGERCSFIDLEENQ